MATPGWAGSRSVPRFQHAGACGSPSNGEPERGALSFVQLAEQNPPARLRGKEVPSRIPSRHLVDID